MHGLNDDFQHPDDVFVWPHGKFAIMLLSVGTVLACIAALTFDILVMVPSQGEYINTIYNTIIVGAAAMLSLRATTRRWIMYAQLGLCLGFVSSVIAYTITFQFYNNTQHLRACAFYEPTTDSFATTSNSCPEDEVGFIALNITDPDEMEVYKDYDCVGFEKYYARAAQCEHKYISKHGEQDRQCDCVSSATEDENRCFSFQGFEDCFVILNDLPQLLYGTLLLTMIMCCAMFLLLMLYCILTRRKFIGNSDRILAQARLQEQNQQHYNAENPHHAELIYDANGNVFNASLPMAKVRVVPSTPEQAAEASAVRPVRRMRNVPSESAASNSVPVPAGHESGPSDHDDNNSNEQSYNSAGSAAASRVAATSGISGRLSDRLTASIAPQPQTAANAGAVGAAVLVSPPVSSTSPPAKRKKMIVKKTVVRRKKKHGSPGAAGTDFDESSARGGTAVDPNESDDCSDDEEVVRTVTIERTVVRKKMKGKPAPDAGSDAQPSVVERRDGDHVVDASEGESVEETEVMIRKPNRTKKEM